MGRAMGKRHWYTRGRQMLSGIFGKKSDHPLADIRSAQKMLDDLPKNDVHKLLMDMAEMMGSVADNTDFKLDHQFAVLRLIDEVAQPYTRKLIGEYFTPSVLNAFQENRLWLVLGNYFRQSGIAYCAVFNRQRIEKGNNSIKAHIPLLLARAVYAMNWQLKFVCAHYDLVEHVIWENLANIFNFVVDIHGLE